MWLEMSEYRLLFYRWASSNPFDLWRGYSLKDMEGGIVDLHIVSFLSATCMQTGLT